MDIGKTVFIFGLLGAGLLLLLTRGRGGYSPKASDSEQSIALPFKASHIRGHHYTNEETWNIEWSPDGLPTKVTIHRNAMQT